MMLALFMPKELNYWYEVTSGLEVGLLSMMYGGDSTWAHAECDQYHLACTFAGAMNAGMRTRSPSESIAKKQSAKIEAILDSDEARSGGEQEEDGKKEEEEEIKYYNKRGKVVGSGPRQPLRFTGVVQLIQQASNPSTAFPCD